MEHVLYVSMVNPQSHLTCTAIYKIEIIAKHGFFFFLLLTTICNFSKGLFGDLSTHI